MNKTQLCVLALLAGTALPAAAQIDTTLARHDAFVKAGIATGAGKDFTRAQSTAAVTTISGEQAGRRSSKNISEGLVGLGGNGLVSMRNAGTYFSANPTFYVRGLQSLSGSSPLLLVDGIERDMNIIDPTEVDHVDILKDAAAVALFGNRGANGAINVITKRGKYNTKGVRVSYDHLFNYQINRPKFISAPTYAAAMNEALANEGKAPKYSADEISAFQNGAYPDLYPNVNWVDATFRHHGMTNKIASEFYGGGQKFKYYTMLNLLSDKGFIKNDVDDNGNHTQDKYVRANMRINLDVDLSPTTLMKVNVLGMLSEMSQPGNQTNLWGLVYNLPSAAFPVKFQKDGLWGGSATWAGTDNPVANTAAAAYYKLHERSLYTDLSLRQDLGMFVPGLSASARMGYDTYSTLYENHSKTFQYGFYAPATWSDGVPTPGTCSIGGEKGTQGTDANTSAYNRRFHFDGGLNYERTLQETHCLFSSLRWEYEYHNTTGVNTSVYRQTASWLTHYAYRNRYIAEMAWVLTDSSRLAPGTKWAVAPTFSTAWVMSQEPWMKDVSWVDFLKWRASFGIVNTDCLPGDNVWTYYTQTYSTDGVTYPFDSSYDSSWGRTTLGRMATDNPSHEKAYKYNVGLDASILHGLDLQIDGYFQRRDNIWVDGSGSYGSIIGFSAPYINAGAVDSWGFEAAADYSHKVGDVTLNIGGTFSLNKNKIKDQAEEPRAYDNLVTTGYPLNSIWGLKAVGLFKDQADIDASTPQTFSEVKPGDIKYDDVNHDGKIDANDRTKIGYSTLCPEIFYSLHIGAEYRGLGFNALFQGVDHYSALLNTSGYYWGLISNRTLSQDVYDHRWTPDNLNAEYPRLSSSSNANNYQTSTFWLRNRAYFKLRNIEVYYNLPKTLLSRTKMLSEARVYVRGNDLFTLDHLRGVDAESYGATSPLTRSVIVGLNVTF